MEKQSVREVFKIVNRQDSLYFIGTAFVVVVFALKFFLIIKVT